MCFAYLNISCTKFVNKSLRFMNNPRFAYFLTYACFQFTVIFLSKKAEPEHQLGVYALLKNTFPGCVKLDCRVQEERSRRCEK